jgi:hypothetical protein
VVDPVRALEQRLDRGQEIVGDGAADAASTPTSPNSLMTNARRRPPAFSSKWRIIVVLPAPRKPVTMVAGILVKSVMAVPG